MARPGFVYTVHKETGGALEFPEESVAFWQARGWEPSDEPAEDGEEPKVSPESPASKKKTSKAAAAADKGEVTGG